MRDHLNGPLALIFAAIAVWTILAFMLRLRAIVAWCVALNRLAVAVDSFKARLAWTTKSTSPRLA